MAEAPVTKVCPVCLGCLDEPKLLPCSHLVCKKCVMAILEKTTENPSGCPSCHRSILPSDEKGDTDLGVFVDNLPTDYVTWVKIQNQEFLSGTACNTCDDSEATSFCFDCGIKLCGICTKYHSKMPLLADHTVEELSTLTEAKLAVKKSLPCSLHKEKSPEMYCFDHFVLVCSLCAASFVHKTCKSLENIDDAVQTGRNDLEEQKQRLVQKEASLSVEIETLNKHISETQAEFDRMRKEVISTFTDIIKCYEAQKNKILDDIDEKEQAWLEEKLSNRDQLEALRSDVAAHTITIDEMISSTQDNGMALLATLGRLKSRLDDLETKKAVTQDKATVGEVYFDDKLVDSLKDMADITGEVRDSSHEQDKVDLFRCLACDTVTEGTFQYERLTENLGKTSGESYSKPCIIRNIPWKIQIRPWTGTNNKCLGFFLHCGVPKNLRSFFCHVKLKLRILNTLPQGQPLEKVSEHTYDKREGWGWPDFIPVDELLDPNNDYVKDGKVTFEAHVAAGVPEWTWMKVQMCARTVATPILTFKDVKDATGCFLEMPDAE